MCKCLPPSDMSITSFYGPPKDPEWSKPARGESGRSDRGQHMFARRAVPPSTSGSEESSSPPLPSNKRCCVVEDWDKGTRRCSAERCQGNRETFTFFKAEDRQRLSPFCSFHAERWRELVRFYKSLELPDGTSLYPRTELSAREFAHDRFLRYLVHPDAGHVGRLESLERQIKRRTAQRVLRRDENIAVLEGVEAELASEEPEEEEESDGGGVGFEPIPAEAHVTEDVRSTFENLGVRAQRITEEARLANAEAKGAVSVYWQTVWMAFLRHVKPRATISPLNYAAVNADIRVIKAGLEKVCTRLEALLGSLEKLSSKWDEEAEAFVLRLMGGEDLSPAEIRTVRKKMTALRRRVSFPGAALHLYLQAVYGAATMFGVATTYLQVEDNVNAHTISDNKAKKKKLTARMLRGGYDIDAVESIDAVYWKPEAFEDYIISHSPCELVVDYQRDTDDVQPNTLVRMFTSESATSRDSLFTGVEDYTALRAWLSLPDAEKLKPETLPMGFLQPLGPAVRQDAPYGSYAIVLSFVIASHAFEEAAQRELLRPKTPAL